MRVRSSALVIGTGIAVSLFSLACAGDGPTAPKFGPPTALIIEGGQDQSAVVGTELTTVLTAKVVDANGRPVPNRTVSFRVASGGGSMFVGSAISSDSGLVRDRWTLGTVAADSQRVEVRTVDASGAALIAVFRAAARPDVPATVTKVSGDTQTVVVGTPAADSLAVRVSDRFGNPVPQVIVRWVVASGGGSLSQDSTLTSAGGTARSRWTVGQQVGIDQRVTATIPGLPSQTFQATLQAAAAVGVAVVAPASGAASGAAFTTSPQVRLVDAFGNTAVGGANPITVLVSTGGTLTGTTTVTPTAGVASYTGVGLSGLVGTYTLTYRATGLVEATQPITLVAGAPTQLVVTTQPAGAVSGAPFTTQPVVELRDNAGNRSISSLLVEASIASGDGTLAGTVSASADSGSARFSSLRIDRAAAHVLLFTVASPTLSVAAEPITVEPGAPAKLEVVRAAAGVVSGKAFRVQPIVEVRDSAGNLTSAVVPVSLSTGGGATLRGVATVTAVAGRAVFGDVGLLGAPGGYTLSFGAVGIASVEQSVALIAPASLATGSNHTCAISEDEEAYCWGYNGNGRLGVGNTTDQVIPTRVLGQLAFVALAGGDDDTCALDDVGQVHCFETSGPQVPQGGGTFVYLGAGSFHMCALNVNQEAHCWGRNEQGQLGDGSYEYRTSPQPLTDHPRYSAISGGRLHTCALTLAGKANCWGTNFAGHLGDGSLTSSISPVAVAGGLTFTSIASGRNHTCALTAEGVAYCWGANGYGQLGDGSTLDRLVPVPVAGGLKFSSLAPGESHSCGIVIDGSAYCWGENTWGQLGDGTTVVSEVPILAASGTKFGALAAGNHTCGLTSAGAILCWGMNNSGQVGIGVKSQRELTPTTVLGNRQYWVP